MTIPLESFTEPVARNAKGQYVVRAIELAEEEKK